MNVSDASDHEAAAPRSKLAITDSTALFSLREGRDLAACAWLCQKYRPLVAHIARRVFTGAQMPDEVVEESLQRAVAALKNDPPIVSAAGVFARAALQVSREWMRPDGQGEPGSDLVA